jgi:hypothetical protein
LVSLSSVAAGFAPGPAVSRWPHVEAEHLSGRSPKRCRHGACCDRLQDGRVDSVVGGEKLQRDPGPVRAGVSGIENVAPTNDVVADNQPAGADSREHELELLGQRGLVGVEEREVERLRDRGRQLESGPDKEVDDMLDSRAREVAPRDLGVDRLEFDGHDAALGRQGASKPDRAVAAEGPEFEDALGADRPREKRQQLSLQRSTPIIPGHAAARDGARRALRIAPAHSRTWIPNGTTLPLSVGSGCPEQHVEGSRSGCGAVATAPPLERIDPGSNVRAF